MTETARLVAGRLIGASRCWSWGTPMAPRSRPSLNSTGIADWGEGGECSP